MCRFMCRFMCRSRIRVKRNIAVFMHLLLLLTTATISANSMAAPGFVEPSDGSILSGTSQTFTWSLNDTEVERWWLYVGSSLGARDIANSGDLGEDTAYDVIGIPADGSTVHARLWYFSDARWQYIDNSYTTATLDVEATTPAIISPTNNSALAGASAQFAWRDNNTLVNYWWLYIGSRQGGKDIYDSGPALRNQTSVTVDQLPVDGSTVHVRLWYRTSADGWQFADTTYSTSTGVDTGLASFTTKSGTWRVAQSGEGFLWTLDEKPGWSSAMACNDTEQTKTVNVGKWTLFVPTHACKFAQDENPVQMDSNMIQQAIDDGRWVGYDTSSAAGWPISFGVPDYYVGSLSSYTQAQYDPAAMNGVSSSDNIVGILSAQGGEYPASRGAIDNADAQLIVKAVNGESIESYTQAMYNIAFASAGYPYRTPFVGTMLRDPQKPLSGLQYEYKINPQEVSDEIYSVNPDPAWKYDAAHLTNVGWALWLATEDPRIGMIVQSATAFTLATRIEANRLSFMEENKGNVSDYRCEVNQDRAIYNCLNGMWRARDVALRTGSSDTMLWSLDRVNQMYAETEEQIQTLMDEVSNAPLSDAKAHALNVTSSPFNGDYSATCAGYQRSDGTEFSALARSNFMDAQYGGVPMYLRAKKGEALGNELLDQVANHMVTRMLDLGGAAGVDGRRDLRGSGLPIGPCVVNAQFGGLEPGPLPFTDRDGWVEWIEQQDIMTVEGLQPSTDSFNNVYAHTAVQIGFILNAAKQMVALGRIAAITDLDAAIAAMDLARQNTAEGQLRFGLWSKHMATPTD